MLRFSKLQALAVISLAAGAFGCSENPAPNAVTQAATAQPPSQSQPPRGTLSIGDDSYGFDTVTCIGMNPATGIATDRANRDNYPTVTLKVFDATLSGGEVINTVSVQFRSESRDELWLLQDGDVEKDGKIFEASGTLKGRRMVTQPNGTLKSAPFADNDLRPFHAQLQCR